jgi:hypothetical protein
MGRDPADLRLLLEGDEQLFLTRRTVVAVVADAALAASCACPRPGIRNDGNERKAAAYTDRCVVGPAEVLTG